MLLEPSSFAFAQDVRQSEYELTCFGLSWIGLTTEPDKATHVKRVLTTRIILVYCSVLLPPGLWSTASCLTRCWAHFSYLFIVLFRYAATPGRLFIVLCLYGPTAICRLGVVKRWLRRLRNQLPLQCVRFFWGEGINMLWKGLSW